MTTRKDKIFYICNELYNNSAGSFRQERWINVMLEKGFDVTVLLVLNSIRVSKITYSSKEEFSIDVKHKRHIIKAKRSVKHGFFAKFGRFCKHVFLVEFFFPSQIILFYLLYKEIRSKKSISIFVSSPPFSLAFVAGILKYLAPKKTYLSVDMRDPWALHWALGGIKLLRKKIESFVLKNADSVSTVSEHIKNLFESTYQINVSLQYNIATHINNISEIPDSCILNSNFGAFRFPENDVCSIVYTGSTSEGFYDLISVSNSINIFYEMYNKIEKRIIFYFIGSCDNLKNLINPNHIENGLVKFISHLPHSEIKCIQKNATLLFFLAHNVKGNGGYITTKIFEYFAMKKPVLAYGVENNSEINRVFLKFCNSTINIQTSNDFYCLLQRIDENRSFINELPIMNNESNFDLLEKSYFEEIEKFKRLKIE